VERQKFYGPDKKILFKKQLFHVEVKGQGPTKVITVRDTPPMKQSVICDRNFLKICDAKYSETCLNLTSLGPDFMFGTDR
jgi:hypothetical protein